MSLRGLAIVEASPLGFHHHLGIQWPHHLHSILQYLPSFSSTCLQVAFSSQSFTSLASIPTCVFHEHNIFTMLYHHLLIHWGHHLHSVVQYLPSFSGTCLQVAFSSRSFTSLASITTWVFHEHTIFTLLYHDFLLGQRNLLLHHGRLISTKT